MEGYRNELHRHREEQRQYSTIKSTENEFPGTLKENFSLLAGTELLTVISPPVKHYDFAYLEPIQTPHKSSADCRKPSLRNYPRCKDRIH